MSDILWDEKRNPIGLRKLKCECGCNDFNIIVRFGAGGSGTYFRFYCVKCNKFQEMDFDNPLYEG